ncbi:ABC transporter permease [Clostridium estertheticum]|uniref:ABC transporter permease n=1 Tax=Clostridium estertheticum TaxID=238834 RepID=UPI001C0C36C6|nr:ABC transporter permease [Clostridium estertheticum]MBU3073101.1 ABC transporter permease [Clostridium estertheticum]MBU3162862.1 ABC transporter permease [Clostridium estertheticum]
MNFIKMVKFDFMNIIRNPMLLIVNTIFPLILIGVMGFVMSNVWGKGSMSIYDYYGIKMMILTALFIAMTATNTFMEEKVKSGNSRIIYAPVSKTSIYLSKLISTYILGTISYSVLILIGQYLLHINFGGNNIIYIMVLINILALLGCSLGTMFCCLFKSEEGANSIMQIPLTLFIFFGGIIFGVHRLGNVVAEISNLSPIKWVNECAIRIIYNNDFSIYLPVLAFLLIASMVCIIICQITFKPEEYV